jgi:hypothetical protein
VPCSLSGNIADQLHELQHHAEKRGDAEIARTKQPCHNNVSEERACLHAHLSQEKMESASQNRVPESHEIFLQGTSGHPHPCRWPA